MLGQAKEDDVYMDIVNIDRYDMIIGTPFLREQKVILNFGRDMMTIQGQAIRPMTAGQEDLVCAERHTWKVQAVEAHKKCPEWPSN